MRILLVEDRVETVERIRSALSDQGSLAEVVVAGSRDEAIARIGEGEFDLVVCDLRIPPTAGRFDSAVQHGEAVYGRLQVELPGVPVVFLTAYGTLEFTQQLLAEGKSEDCFGTRQNQAMVRLFTKDQLPECVRHILQVESEYAAIDDIEIVWEAEAESLTSSQARALRVCGRRHEARVVRLSSLRQGMSDARTLRIRLMGTNGTAVAHLVGKLGLLADVHDELSRYEMHVGPRLPQGSFTPLATVVRAGAGRGGGLFYTLAEQYSESLFSLLARDETAAVAVLDRLKDIEGRWTGGVPAVEETVSEARRRLQKDDAVVLARLSDRIDVATFEARSLQVRRAVEHGDLHGENVLVDPEARAVLIDYGSVIAATASLDPVTLELSLLFHPRGAAIRGEWPAPDVVATWSDLDRYVEHCPVPAFVRACRSWAWEVGNGGREVLSNAYAYATRQFGYPDVTQDLARAVAVSAATAFQAT